MKIITVYLDTNIVSRILGIQLSEETIKALVKLGNMEIIQLVTSKKTKQEILETPNPDRNLTLQLLYVLITKIQTLPIEYGGALGAAPLGATPLGGFLTDPLYLKLNKIFDEADAEHIFQAIKAKCDYFMTIDHKTILRRAKNHSNEVKEACGNMLILSPEEVLENILKEYKER